MFSSTSFSGLGQFSQFCKNTNVSGLEDIKLMQKLVVTIQQGDVKGVKKILKRNVNVNEYIRFDNELEKMTALHFATKNGMVEIVREILMVKSCEVNKPTPFDQSTALHLVCANGADSVGVVIATDLLSYGADPNTLDHAGRTPLMLSAQLGDPALVNLLLDSGALIDCVCENDEYPEAIRRTHKLIDMPDKEVAEMYDPYKGNTCLMQACREHHLSIVSDLLQRNCDVTLTNTCGNTALHIAAKSETRSSYQELLTRQPVAGNPVIVRTLLRHGCAMDVRNSFGDTPLKRAVDGIQEVFCWNIEKEDKLKEAKVFCEVVEVLVKSGADVRLPYDGESVLTALLKTAERIDQLDCLSLTRKFQTCLELIILAGSDITERDITYAERFPSNRPAVDLLRTFAKQPWSLRRMCKIVVRRQCKKPVEEQLSKLELPQFLQSYLALDI